MQLLVSPPRFRRFVFTMFYGPITTWRLAILVALSTAVWACWVPSHAEAATCGHYLYSTKDLARAHTEAGKPPFTSSVQPYGHSSNPVPTCQGPQCGRNHGAPAAPQPLLRSGRLHEPLFSTSAQFELNNLVEFCRLLIAAETTDGCPCRIKRPPRRDSGLDS